MEQYHTPPSEMMHAVMHVLSTCNQNATHYQERFNLEHYA
jgi:hypothetical protein